MILKNEEGRKIELFVYESGEDIVVDEAYYLDDGAEEVPLHELAFLLNTYSAEIEEYLLENGGIDYEQDAV